jgi:hypothetical protein
MSQTAPRVLYVDDQVPRATLGAGFPRAAQIVRSLALSERQQTRLLRAELRMTEIASSIVAVSADDAAQIAKLTSRPARVLSHAGAPVPTPSPFHERRGLLFLGAIHGEDTPNGDSLSYFFRDVMPRCVGRDHLPVRIAGAGTDNADAFDFGVCEEAVATDDSLRSAPAAFPP